MRIECGCADDDDDDYTTTTITTATATTTTTLSTVTIRDGLIEFYYTCHPYTKTYLQCVRHAIFNFPRFSFRLAWFFHVYRSKAFRCSFCVYQTFTLHCPSLIFSLILSESRRRNEYVYLKHRLNRRQWQTTAAIERMQTLYSPSKCTGKASVQMR